MSEEVHFWQSILPRVVHPAEPPTLWTDEEAKDSPNIPIAIVTIIIHTTCSRESPISIILVSQKKKKKKKRVTEICMESDGYKQRVSWWKGFNKAVFLTLDDGPIQHQSLRHIHRSPRSRKIYPNKKRSCYPNIFYYSTAAAMARGLSLYSTAHNISPPVLRFRATDSKSLPGMSIRLVCLAQKRFVNFSLFICIHLLDSRRSGSNAQQHVV